MNASIDASVPTILRIDPNDSVAMAALNWGTRNNRDELDIDIVEQVENIVTGMYIVLANTHPEWQILSSKLQSMIYGRLASRARNGEKITSTIVTRVANNIAYMLSVYPHK